MKTLLPALGLLVVASAAIAQTTPPPPQPFPAPITGYTGRYLDSAETPDFQFPNRTLRTDLAKAAPELNLMLVDLSGSEFAAYDLSTFPQRLASGPLATGAHGEKYLPPAISFDAQAPGSGFNAPHVDGQKFLFDFDYDDRGNFYLAYSIWGFAILDHSAHLITQVETPPFVPFISMSVKSGAAYDVLISDAQTGTAVYDATNPGAPALLRTLPIGIISYAKSANAIGIVTAGGHLRLYDAAALVSGGAAFRDVAPPAGAHFTSVATDGNRFFATIGGFGNGMLDILTRQTDGSYSEALTSLGTFMPFVARYGGGYVSMGGVRSTQVGLMLARVDGATPVLYDLVSYLHSAYPTGETVPSFGLPFTTGGGTYLLGAFNGIGDVFALAAVVPPTPPPSIPTASTFALIAIAVALAAVAAIRLR